MSLLLAGAAVLTSLDPPRLADGDVLIDGGRVVAILPAGRSAPEVEAAATARRRDCSGCLVVPGNVCAHSHLYSSLARGMPARFAPPRTFLETLQRVWWRLDRGLDEASVRASALVAGADALLAGTTTVVDHHASPNAIDGSLDLIAEALAGLGLRSVLCYETSDRDGRDRAHAAIRENARFQARTRGDAYPLARAMIGAHASFTLSDDTLAECVDAASAAGTGLHIHVAEDDLDQRDARARCGRRVVERLARAGALDDRALLAHAVHLDPNEAERLRESGCTVVHNARSNMHNAVGRPPLARLGPKVALGTDGIGGVGADMFEESRVAWLRHREDGDVADPGWSLARLAQGSRFAGRLFGEPRLGAIEPGAPADLVVLGYDPPTPLHDDNVASHWLFGLGSAAVRDVLVGGEIVVADRRLTRLDAAAIAAEGRREAVRLWRRLEEIGPHLFEPAGDGRAATSARGLAGDWKRGDG